MRPGSAFLAELDANDGKRGALPIFTYRTPFDLMVVPARTTRLASATEVVVWCPFHSMLPGYGPVMDHIASSLARVALPASLVPP